MSEPPLEYDAQPEGLARRSRGLSLVWLLPLVAALIAAWLLYKDFTQGDIRATILFSTGDGLVKGKTAVKYSGVEIGVVDDFRLVPNAKELNGQDGVLAEVSFNRSAAYLLTQGSKFWLVKPEVSLTGVRGLETLVSGNYIAVEPGSGATQKHFVAVPEPPAYVRGDGLRVTLKAPRLASLNRGSPVYYRQLEVGQVESYRLAEGASEVEIDLFIRREYAHLVHRGSRFWNASGVSIQGGISGVNVEVESLASLIAGGVSFYTPDAQRQSPKAEDGNEFKLYKSFAEADAGIPITLNFDRGVSLSEGSTQVIYQGITVGQVSTVKANRNIDGMEVEVLMDPITDDLLTENTRFWLAPPTLDFTSGVDDLLKGNRIEVDLRSGNRSVRTFEAEASPPPRDERTPGLHLRLTAKNTGSIQRGASVYYRQVEVGRVQGMELKKDGSSIIVYVVIQPRYAHLVNSDSRFWNVSGVRASAGLQGIKVETDALLSVVRGGIAFGSGPHQSKNAARARSGDSFRLYGSRDEALEEGINIYIDLTGDEGLKVGSPLRYRGIQVGEITRMRLNYALDGVRAKARLYRRAERFARTGTRMWVVGPKIGLGGVDHLDTLVTGPFLELDPGLGNEPQTDFVALAAKPEPDLADTMMMPGLALILDAPRRGSLKRGSPVYYRQIKVGQVTGYQLGELADRVYIYVYIEPEYRSLVREHSKFWNASGVDVNFGVMTGLDVHTESAQALLAGGIAFATPNNAEMGLEVESGSHYPLYGEPEDEWLLWSPKIELYPALEDSFK
ncbi:PqiB family protein [Microbulbifer hydrolyticus]|uniref:MCE family protein n=1 Tax=Microbulbifer hydrolyticus TaxID=48074 RepID=A0A6P1TA20_9GAMM|nr:MlaD family protein [Microbulbifer hydrolyticus]MBB5211117.1 paraquat-inducible protein B [Microbulbifer hydrolyticus]QHQ38099.1 MCE family protein [Microbulbifer hydrolyticus]